MRRGWQAAALAGAALAAGCTNGGGPGSGGDRFIDLRFPVAARGAAPAYSHAVDRTGTLWYLDGGTVVRESEPDRRRAIALPAARAGRIFWYGGAIYVLAGDGTQLFKIDSRLGASATAVPPAYAPLSGIVADARHRWIVAAQAAPNRLAVVDVWKWYAQPLPGGIEPFATSLAGGAHGKKYLVVADRRQPEVVVVNRWNQNVRFLRAPDNGCFAGTPGAFRVPVDVRGRDGARAWVSAGEHAASIDLPNAKTLRVWDLPGCAMQIVGADGAQATIVVSAPDGNARFATSVVRIDRDGVHPLAQYGRVDGLNPGMLLDAYGRLWWYDSAAHAFVCRTPLR